MNNMEGKGKETWGDGRLYVGDFKGGRKDGEGVFEWPNGNKYLGSWKKGQQHGSGIMMDSSTGTKRQGEWAEGLRKRWISGIEELSIPSPAKLRGNK